MQSVREINVVRFAAVDLCGGEKRKNWCSVQCAVQYSALCYTARRCGFFSLIPYTWVEQCGSTAVCTAEQPVKTSQAKSQYIETVFIKRSEAHFFTALSMSVFQRSIYSPESRYRMMDFNLRANIYRVLACIYIRGGSCFYDQCTECIFLHLFEGSFGLFTQVSGLFSSDTWLILPVVICLSQRLSHACLSTSQSKVKPRMAH